MNLTTTSGSSVGNNCETCIKSKHRHTPIKSRGPKTTRPPELVHVHLAGPLPEDLSKERYCLLMVDDCTRYPFEELSDDETGTTEKNLPRPVLPALVRSSLNIPGTSPIVRRAQSTSGSHLQPSSHLNGGSAIGRYYRER